MLREMSSRLTFRDRDIFFGTIIIVIIGGDHML